MFKAIFQYEIKYWLRQPSTYIYGAILFVIAFLAMSGMASEPPSRFSNRIVNSPFFLLGMTRRFMMLIFLLLPAVIGMSVYRDFGSRMHSLLFAYPFRKGDYLLAKFLSSFLVFSGIAFLLMLAYWLGTLMPWADPGQVADFGFGPYLQQFIVLLLPNLLLLSTIVFGIVLWSRNIFTGFIAALAVVLVQQISRIVFSETSEQALAALFDPTGFKAFSFYTQNWSVAAQNELFLPMGGWVLANRLLWIGVAGLIFLWTYRSFQFHYNPPTFSWRKNTLSVHPIPSLGSITKVILPKVTYNFSFIQQIKNTWQLSHADFLYVIRSKSFISITLGGLAFILLALTSINSRWGTETLPMTWQVLELPSMFYSGIVNAMTFLYAGFLIHRDRMTNMSQLVDASAVPNSVLLGAKFLALIKMQMVLLFAVMVGGMFSQAIKGFYDFEIGQYLFNLFGLNLIHFVIWAMLALFIQSLFNNPYLGFFLLLFAPVGFIGIAEFGPQYLGLNFLEQFIFRYNQAPGGVFGVQYSDMDGYGALLKPYFFYKFYWFLGGLLLLIGAVAFWTRGFADSFKNRLTIARQRFSGKLAVSFMLVLMAFLSIGASLFYETNIKQTYFSRGEKRTLLSAAEKKYKHYEFAIQPKIVAVNIDMDIFPEQRQFKAKGHYWLINQSAQAIDTLVINYAAGLNTTYKFDQKNRPISKERIANLSHFDLILLEEKLLPGDSLFMTFENHNDPMTIFRTNTFVKSHGTFIEDDIFPRFGNWLSFFRESNQMGKHRTCQHPTDSLALTHSFMSKDAGYVDFEATVSTTADQIAIAPGQLQKDWTENDRHYFHYKTNTPIALSYLFMSGDYAIATDKWEDVDVAIYYHKAHTYNIDRMMNGLKAGLDYCSNNFSPYQFEQLSMVEFSQVGGSSAHGFPSVIPAGEGIGFVAAIEDGENGGTDYAFGTAVHEVAHQWWGHQVIPADVLGAKLVVESMAEYVNVMVKKHEKGEAKMRSYLEANLRSYLQARSMDRLQESPLLLTHPSQNYIHYPKGANALYTLSDYIGEDTLNQAIRKYVEQVAFQESPHTTSIDLVEYFRAATPDSLQYLIKDLFETVTLYDNRVLNWTSKPLANGQFQVDIDFVVSKFRSGENGAAVYEDMEGEAWQERLQNGENVQSLPLSDYIEIGVFGENGEELYLQKVDIGAIQNSISIIVSKAPAATAVDPYFKLIDVDLDDNEM